MSIVTGLCLTVIFALSGLFKTFFVNFSSALGRVDPYLIRILISNLKYFNEFL